jgi:hypothetical protein
MYLFSIPVHLTGVEKEKRGWLKRYGLNDSGHRQCLWPRAEFPYSFNSLLLVFNHLETRARSTAEPLADPNSDEEGKQHNYDGREPRHLAQPQ